MESIANDVFCDDILFVAVVSVSLFSTTVPL